VAYNDKSDFLGTSGSLYGAWPFCERNRLRLKLYPAPSLNEPFGGSSMAASASIASGSGSSENYGSQKSYQENGSAVPELKNTLSWGDFNGPITATWSTEPAIPQNHPEAVAAKGSNPSTYPTNSFNDELADPIHNSFGSYVGVSFDEFGLLDSGNSMDGFDIHPWILAEQRNAMWEELFGEDQPVSPSLSSGASTSTTSSGPSTVESPSTSTEQQKDRKRKRDEDEDEETESPPAKVVRRTASRTVKVAPMQRVTKVSYKHRIS
jgi:hypothetical protein